MELNINIKQKQTLHLSKELKNAIEVLALNNLELAEYVNKEAQENVILDFADSTAEVSMKELIKEYRNTNYYNRDDEVLATEENKYESYTTSENTLHDYLHEQLHYLPLKNFYLQIGEYLIENIDHSGYLQVDLNTLAKDLNVAVHDIYYVLQKIQRFDPKGIGSRNLKECLLAQTEDKILRIIIRDHLEDIADNKIQKIAKALYLTPEGIYKHIDSIKKLNPLPASGFETDENPTQYISPEIFVYIKGNSVEVEIKDNFVGKLHLNDYYLSLLENSDEETAKYLEIKIKRAMFLIESINLRRENIKKVVNSIVKFQRNFFLYGGSLNPLIMKDVAIDTNLSESTVSRVTDNKYLECKQGTFQLKHFFSTSLGSGASEVSSDYIMQRIQSIVKDENKCKPLSDQAITEILTHEGIEIKRRTVSKYRDELKIASSSKRKLIK